MRLLAPQVEVKLTCIGPHMLAKFSNNQRPDLYPTDRHLAFAWADILNQEMREVVRAGCEFIQFDEPAWTAFPEEAAWGAAALNRAVEGLNVKVGLHVCGGNAHRKRVYFTRYDDLAGAFAAARIDQVSLEYCTLSYNMFTLWEKWKFKGNLPWVWWTSAATRWSLLNLWPSARALCSNTSSPNDCCSRRSAVFNTCPSRLPGAS